MKSEQFQAVHAAVQAGSTQTAALRAHGVTYRGYRLWMQREGLQPKRVGPWKLLDGPFKAAEREIRQCSLNAFAERHGVKPRHLRDAHSLAIERRPRLEALYAEFLSLPTTEEICERHGVNRRQLYAWRFITGGLPK